MMRGQIFSCLVCYRYRSPSVDGEGEWCHVTHLLASCFFGMWGWVGMAMRGERTHRSDVLCGRWRIKQRVGDRDGKITHLSQRREQQATRMREDKEDVCASSAPPPRSDFNFITRGKQKAQVGQQLL